MSVSFVVVFVSNLLPIIKSSELLSCCSLSVRFCRSFRFKSIAYDHVF